MPPYLYTDAKAKESQGTITLRPIVFINAFAIFRRTEHETNGEQYWWKGVQTVLIVTSGADSLGTLDDKCDDQTMQLTPSQASIVTGVPTVPSSGKGI